MKTQLSRRDWFRSTLSMTAGLTLGSSVIEQLMAAPMSEAEKQYGFILNKPSLVRLGSNENPYGPSPKARQAMVDIMSEGNRYGFDAGRELVRIIAEREGVSTDHVMLGAGSSELLCLSGMMAGLEGGSVLSSYPTFRLLMDYAAGFNARWDQVNLDDTLTHDLDKMLSAIKADTKLIFLCNPNNPTGTFVDKKKVRDFCIEASKRAIVFSDEAYIEFLDEAQQAPMTDLVRQGHNVIVSRTFSKIYGLAGMRIGYIIARPEIIANMKKRQTGGIMNQAGVAAAKVSLGDMEFINMTRKLNAEARKHLTDYLDGKKWLYGKSSTNVVLFPAPKPGREILKQTEERGFQIRVWDYQDREWCRVSIGTLDEMKRFTKAFDEVVS
ncbi:MAG: histidinol-phosphate transaminase [Cyclobacteriaceae bacterium]